MMDDTEQLVGKVITEVKNYDDGDEILELTFSDGSVLKIESGVSSGAVHCLLI